MRLSREPMIHEGCSITESTLGDWTELGAGTRFSHSELGDYSYCDRGCDIANAHIGKFSNIASAVRIGATDHPLNRASLHHFLYRSADYWDDAEHDGDWFAHRKSRVAKIGHDTWIGHGAQIKPEVTIGHGAVIASGAIVTKDVPPYMIVSGVPAAPMRPRLEGEIVDQMIALAWWDWSHDALRDALSDFRSLEPEAFLAKYA